VVVAVAVIALPAAGGAAGKTAKVTITGDTLASYAFDPAKVKVKKGDRVRWTWDSNAPHNVSVKKLDEASGTDASGSFKLKFSEPGTYRYTCTIHGFKGKVVVG
jgi:plastocyanin